MAKKVELKLTKNLKTQIKEREIQRIKSLDKYFEKYGLTEILFSALCFYTEKGEDVSIEVTESLFKRAMKEL